MITLDAIKRGKYGYEYDFEINKFHFIIKTSSDGEILEIVHSDQNDTVCPLCHFDKKEKHCPKMEIKYREEIQNIIFSLKAFEKILKN